MIDALGTFVALLMGHALADFALQSDTMARGKNRHRQPDRTLAPTGRTYQVAWPYWLTSHAMIHGLVVAGITVNVWLGLAETIAHWVIDYFKCENKYGIHVDQCLHVLCKIGISVYVFYR